jgi:hypothetical protein
MPNQDGSAGNRSQAEYEDYLKSRDGDQNSGILTQQEYVGQSNKEGRAQERKCS